MKNDFVFQVLVTGTIGHFQRDASIQLSKHQCDKIGQNFAIWAIFFALGAVLSEEIRPNDLGALFSKQKSLNIHLNKLYKLRLDAKLQNVKRQNVEQITENIAKKLFGPS
jgi:hypothetical protein